MGIFVKRMEMPDDCRNCPFEMYYMNCGETRCRATGKILADFYKPIPFEGRAEECPLIELPTPHGDLIDADALNKTLIEMSEIEWNKGVSCSWSDAFKGVTDVVNFEPIIIEGEDE